MVTNQLIGDVFITNWGDDSVDNHLDDREETRLVTLPPG